MKRLKLNQLIQSERSQLKHFAGQSLNHCSAHWVYNYLSEFNASEKEMAFTYLTLYCKYYSPKYNIRNVDFGTMVSKGKNRCLSESGLESRFFAVLDANNPRTVSSSLNSFMSYLKADTLPLDWELFFTEFMSRINQKSAVNRKWLESYYQPKQQKEKEKCK